MRARGMGSQVIVTEVNPVRALEAVMDGFMVTTMEEAAAIGDIFVTATGDINVIDRAHFERMHDGAIICNAGHFNSEINLHMLDEMAAEGRRHLRPFVEEYRLTASRGIIVLGEGRLINLASAEGHPASVMDMSFANQALACAYLVQEKGNLDKVVHAVPRHIDDEIAALKLHSMKITIDTLTPEQEHYLSSWQSGT